jgi:hypothetical protein
MNQDERQATSAQHDGAPQPHEPYAEDVQTALATRPAGKPSERKGAMQRIGDTAKTPAGGAVVTGAIVLGAASLFGAGPVALGAGAAYGIYLYVNRRRPHE